MRLVSLDLAGFRGFASFEHFDLDADAIVVVGANGHGKTSLFDAVLWSMTGRVPRLKGDDANLVSMYSDTGQARAELRLRDGDGEYTIVRSFDGQEARMALRTPTGSFEGQSAESRLIDLIWPDAGSASDPREALALVLTRSVYLQQDLVRDFVDATSDRDRFAAVSELFGAGRVTELQAGLETAKRAWSTVTNQRDAEIEPLRQRLSSLEARLSQHSVSQVAMTAAGTDKDLRSWQKSLAAVGLQSLPPKLDTRQIATLIDGVIKELEALRLQAARRVAALRAVQAEAGELEGAAPQETDDLREKAERAEKNLEEQRLKVSKEQERLVEFRRLRSMLKDKSAQLKALAALALHHLDDLCPVCAQSYDKNATRLRLERLATDDRSEDVIAPEEHTLIQLLAALAVSEREAAASEAALQAVERARIQRSIREDSLTKRMVELGVPALGASRKEIIIAEISTTDQRIRRLIDLQKEGEALALRIAHSSAAVGAEENRREAAVLRRDIAVREKELTTRTSTGNLAQRVIEELRLATSSVVEERLREIAPLFQGVYSRIDPHPSFRAVAFLSRIVRGRGELLSVVSDLIERKDCNQPETVLSSSQMNALAVCVFLALNLGAPRPPMSLTILDDPLQSLDDINLLGLVDLLRRTKDRRQLCVSTHDVRFGDLLARKLRPTGNNGRTIVIDLSSWSRKGPRVSTREVQSDPALLRLVAS